ncbi:putative MFS family arabinose efflux permease [Bogoriella caseilytica]|uniref:Putative MFS family arabinose efflux permease n=1 Tax=Bogoriella caseilytica TaxID=56055 RepID=A0A3N2BDH4_9MICO|nr:putative MFS family arabinose efflux permease [Bogoriella caseilytica]
MRAPVDSPSQGSGTQQIAQALAVDEAAQQRLHRRTLAVVVLSQVLGGAGLAAGITVGALLAQDMLGSDGLTGLPTALFTVGSAASAFLIGRFTQRLGRRLGLGLGFTAGALGAAGVVVAAVLGSAPLLFLALFIYGAGTAANLQARYAGTDLALPAQRGTAVSVALVSTTLGAVAGPNLVEPLGTLATGLGIPALAGPFLLAGVAYLAAGLALLALLRPDPFLVARELEVIAAGPPVAGQPPEESPPPATGAYVGAAVMVLAQISMVAIMTMTPVHMRAHHHDLGEVGLVIGIHVGAMYLPSLLTGVLVDKIGRTAVALASGVTLLLAGVVAAVAPGDSLGLLILALALLGIGWNFGVIAGTALVVDGTVPANRARTQGSIDVLIALAGAGGGVASGAVMSATSYGTLSLAGGVLALLLIPVLLWARRRPAGV